MNSLYISGWEHESEHHVPNTDRSKPPIIRLRLPLIYSEPVKQSLPFIYLSFEANSTDGRPHSVQVYSDISAGTLLVIDKPKIVLIPSFRVDF